MFEAAELGSRIQKEDYRIRAPRLRAELLDVQQQLRRANFPVIVLFAGVDTAGKGETVNLLNEWMDPRWLHTRAYGAPSDEERERPEFWRYWRDLPPKGRIGLFLNAWYSNPVLDRVYRRISSAELHSHLDRIAAFERALTDDGAVILKVWMHLKKSAQRKRLESLEQDSLTRWRVTRLQWKHWRMYKRFIAAAEQTIQHTSTADAPWMIVEGLDPHYRSLTVGTALRDAIRRRLGAAERAVSSVSAPALPSPQDTAKKDRRRAKGDARERDGVFSKVTRERSLLSRLELSRTMDKKAFATRLEKLQGRLNVLQRRSAAKGVSTIVVFEGWDAAGKGGAIRRVTAALDARDYRVIQIAAPSDEERAQHYLWRFWRHISRAGRWTVFDRSWYGRVLVERVEGFATEPEWMRAYSEINQFEEQLVEHGSIVVKFWLHISPLEQLRRFKDRERRAHKRWKITEEDWRNRKKWSEYEVAVNDMVERTSTRMAPWTLVEANDKNYSRIKVLETLAGRLEKAGG